MERGAEYDPNPLVQLKEIACTKHNITHNGCTPMKHENRTGVAVQGCNSNTWEAKAGESTQA